MDLQGVNEKYTASKGEIDRAIADNAPDLPNNDPRKLELVNRRYHRVCEVAEWHGGKGPRSITDPIVLKVVPEGRIVARVSTYDSKGELVDNHCGVSFVTRVFMEASQRDQVSYSLGNESFTGRTLAATAEQTLLMLETAIRDPELNPGFQQYLSVL